MAEMMEKSLAEMFDEAEQAMVPPDLKAKGWRYVDLPTKFSHEMWNYFLRLLGDDEYQIIVASQGRTSGGFEWKRGQLFISPDGMANLRDKERRDRLAPPWDVGTP